MSVPLAVSPQVSSHRKLDKSTCAHIHIYTMGPVARSGHILKVASTGVYSASQPPSNTKLARDFSLGCSSAFTQFADFDAAEIRKRLTASDIRSFFRFKNLAWFGRLSPLPLMKTVVVADAANVNIPRTLYHGGLSTAKTYIQAMTSTIPMIGVRVAEVHVVNVPAAGVILLSLIKALSPKEMEFFVHRTINDFRAYAAEHIGIDNLPEHFGGTNKCPMDDTEMERCFSQFCQEAMMTEERKKSTTLDQETLAKLHDEARKKRVSAEIEESFDDLGD